MENLICLDRVAFYIGSTAVYWYGIIMCLAIIVAIIVASFLCKKKGIDTDVPINMALVVIPSGMLGARLFACLFDGSLSISDFFNFRTGGMSIMGAICCGGLALLIYFLIKKDKNALLYFDLICTVLILAQAIGRWGNFFNQELYGKLIDPSSPFAVFPFAVEINGSYYQALFFYEFVANLIGFFLIAGLFLKQKSSGYAMATYLAFYGLTRTILEPLRQQEYILMLGNIAVSRLLSIAMLVCGVVMFVLLIIRDKRRNDYGKKTK